MPRGSDPQHHPAPLHHLSPGGEDDRSCVSHQARAREGLLGPPRQVAVPGKNQGHLEPGWRGHACNAVHPDLYSQTVMADKLWCWSGTISPRLGVKW